MKTLKTLLLILFVSQVAAQNNQWTWIKGNNAIDLNGVYGTLGVAAPSNNPGSREFFANWTDNSGNFWLFGGTGFGNSGGLAHLSDLWRYDVVSNQWTWVNGDSATEQYSVYGTKGVSAPSNKPGIRTSPSNWVDTSGKLWMFGGLGNTTSATGYLNDLWRYDPSINEWVWMSGHNSANQRGTYGTRGVASAANRPGARYRAITWRGANGKLWLYGGFGFAQTGAAGHLNDLWSYSIITNEWTWENGDSTIDQLGIYGTLGVSAPANKPGARYGASGTTDAAGNLYLFAGRGFAAFGAVNRLNDLWRYDITTGEWTWLNGDNVTNLNGVYGTKSVEAASNKPGARDYAVLWRDPSGYFWMFSGYGFPASGGSGYLNDMWRYNPANNRWAWVHGSNGINQFGNYGTQGVTGASITPGGRYATAKFIQSTGNLWVFGGNGYSGSAGPAELNDFFTFLPSVTLPVQFTGFTADLQQNKTLLTWSTVNEINNKSFHVQRSQDGEHFASIGSVESSMEDATVHNYSYVDASPLSGINYYRIQQVDVDGQTTYSTIEKVNNTSSEAAVFSVANNPSAGILTVQWKTGTNKPVTFSISNTAGQVMYQQVQPATGIYHIPVNNLPAGIYQIAARSNGMVQTKSFIRQ